MRTNVALYKKKEREFPVYIMCREVMSFSRQDAGKRKIWRKRSQRLKITVDRGCGEAMGILKIKKSSAHTVKKRQGDSQHKGNF